MKLVSYVELPLDRESLVVRLGALSGEECVIDLPVAQTWAQGRHGFRARELPGSMMALLNNWEDDAPHLAALLDLLPGDECIDLKGAGRQPVARSRADVLLLPPLPNSVSLRQFDGFEKHVRNVQRLHSRAIPKAWQAAPLFSYGNPMTIYGPDHPVGIPQQSAALDYGLEVACVLSRSGRDIAPEEANDFIAGYMVANNWGVRDLEEDETDGGVGPTKARDFATTIGPALVTADELDDRREGEGADLRYGLTMSARVNGLQKSQGNFGDIHWTFAQMIARASQDVTLYSGEIFTSGAVETGTLYEQGAMDRDEWLKPGDRVECEIERLGTLVTQVID